MKRGIDEIQVGKRFREDLGDLDELAASIEQVGLLHPVVILADGTLVAGARRLGACRVLGWEEVPVTVADNMESARQLLVAERDENTCRVDMKRSEQVALGMALEEMERPKAKERQEASRIRDGSPPGAENFTAPSRGYTRDIVGQAVGMSGPTYQRAKAVVRAAQSGDPVAIEALQEMDKTGKVTPAHDKIAHIVGNKKAGGGVTRTGKGRRSDPSAPYEPTTERQHGLANGQKKRLSEVLSGIAGFCRGLEDIDLGMARSACTVEECSTWAKLARDQSRQLAKLARELTPGGER